MFILPWLGKSANVSSAWFLRPYWVGDFIGNVLVAGYAQKCNKVERAIIIGAFACSASSAIMFIWWKGRPHANIAAQVLTFTDSSSNAITCSMFCANFCLWRWLRCCDSRVTPTVAMGSQDEDRV